MPGPTASHPDVTPAVRLAGDALTGYRPPGAKALPQEGLPTGVKLGRLPPTPTERRSVLPLGKYLRLPKTKPPPAIVDWSAKAHDSLVRVYLNDREGDCVIASNYHLYGVWTGNDAGAAVTVPDSEVQATYNAWKAGPGDSGCVIVDVLNNWRTQGLSVNGTRHKIAGFLSADHTQDLQIKVGTTVFGGGKIGINLPDDWTKNAVWDVTNSRIVGGHDVMIAGYNADGVVIASWGRLYLITWRAFIDRRWVDECYFLLGPEWYGSDKLAPNGISADQLLQDLQAWPNVEPGPDAPPTPTPPPPGPTPPGPAVYPNYNVNLKGSVPTLFGGQQPVTLTGTATPATGAGDVPAGGLAGAANWLAVLGDLMALYADWRHHDQQAMVQDALKLLADLGITLPFPVTPPG